MNVKELLKGAIEGTGDVAKDVMGTATDLVKEGTADIGELFGAVVELGAEGVGDVTSGVRDVFIGSVKALEESGKTTEEAVEVVATKATSAVSNISKEGMEDASGAAQKGIEEAKEIVKKPIE